MLASNLVGSERQLALTCGPLLWAISQFKVVRASGLPTPFYNGVAWFVMGRTDSSGYRTIYPSVYRSARSQCS